MAPQPLDKMKDAQYHAIAATERWLDFVTGQGAPTPKTAAARQREDAQRKRETTYARGELGGH
jgi:hypothetical protein